MNPMIGVSLNPNLLLGTPKNPTQEKIYRQFGSAQALLTFFKGNGAQSVELRTVKPGMDPAIVQKLAQTVWQAGLQVTVHAEMKSVQTAVEDVLSPLGLLWQELPQPGLTVTVHPLKPAEPILDYDVVFTEAYLQQTLGETVQALQDICAEAERQRLPIKLALEYNRFKPKGDASFLCENLLWAKEQVQNPLLGFCWDFGHYYYNQALLAGAPTKLPPEAFSAQCIHTHIHGVENSRTHFPLPGNQPQLAAYCRNLKENGYTGVWNLELEPERFDDGRDLLAAYRQSLGDLEQALQELFS